MSEPRHQRLVEEVDGPTGQADSGPSSSSSQAPPDYHQVDLSQVVGVDEPAAASAPPAATGATTGGGGDSTSETTKLPVGNSGGATIHLNVRTLTGQTFAIDVPDTAEMNVLNLKEAIEETYNIPVSFQRLIYSGRELVDNSTLKQNRIENGNVVHMVLRQNAGPAQSHGPALTPIRNEGGFGYFPNFGGGDGAALPLANDANNNAGGGNGTVDTQRVMDAWQLSRAVKMFAIVDALFLLIWSFAAYWPMVLLILALCGYYGALHYRLSYVVMYVMYLLFIIGLRIYWIVQDQGEFVLTLMLVLGVLIEVYILNLTIRLIMVLRRLTDAERHELRTLHHPHQVPI